jgi:hypothetical protein
MFTGFKFDEDQKAQSSKIHSQPKSVFDASRFLNIDKYSSD